MAEGGRYVLLPGSRANRRKRADLFDEAMAEARKHIPLLRGVTLEGMSRERAALALNAADVVLMTSDREGSPVAVRESLACMTPVVSVDVGDVAEVLARPTGMLDSPTGTQEARHRRCGSPSDRTPPGTPMAGGADIETGDCRAGRGRVQECLGCPTRVEPRSGTRLCMVVHGPFPPDPRVARAVESPGDKAGRSMSLPCASPDSLPTSGSRAHG